MSNARNLANLLGTGTQITTADIADGAFQANKNLIINGAMQVAQRGTSGFTTSGGYTLDRWWMSNAASVEQSTDVPDGFAYSLKINTTTANTSIGQPIELTTGSAYPMSVGQTVTVSLYAKVASGTDDFFATINFRDSKFSSTNQSAFGNGDTWILTTSWQRFTTTFTVPSVNATNVLAGLEIFGIDGDTYITGVQLELGDTATPFEHRNYGEELALCQRYFQKIGGPSYTGIGTCASFDTVSRAGVIHYAATMRVVPSFSVTDNTGFVVTDRTGYDKTTSSFFGISAGTDSLQFNVAHDATGVNRYRHQLAVRNGTTNYVLLDAEL